MTGPTQERIAVLEEVRDMVDAKIARCQTTLGQVPPALSELRVDLDDLIETAKLAWSQTR
jgi:hypothetical protein